MNSIENTKKEMPILKNDERLYVYLQGNHFQQNNVLTSSNDYVINKMQITKMLLIIQKRIIKDMVYVLMKEVSLVIQ